MRFLAALAGILMTGTSWGGYNAITPTPGLRETKKAFGVLLLLEESGPDWNQTAQALAHGLERKFPVELAVGLDDPRALQKNIDRLEARTRKIVAVPVVLFSHSWLLEQTRFLLNLREKPPSELLLAPHSHHQASNASTRVRSHVPLVMAEALEGQPTLIEILAARAKSRSRDRARESLVIVAQVSNSKEEAKKTAPALNALAEKVRQKAGFKSARGASLATGVIGEQRQKQEALLGALVRSLRREGPVIVMALGLGPSELQTKIPKILEGSFARFEARPLLPDPRIARWVEEVAEKTAALPDMRIAKEAHHDRRRSYPSLR